MNYHSLKYFLLLIMALLLMSGCASLPPNSDTQKSYALQDTANTRLGIGYKDFKPKDSTTSGFLLLGNGLDAFTA